MSIDLDGIEAVVFDAYGTLFDVHAAVGRHAGRVGPDAARLSEIWRAKQLEYSWVLSLAGRYVPFWELTARALDHALARCPAVEPSLRPLLLDAYRTLAAYPEVAEALSRLRREGRMTAILSNGDPGMLASAVAAAGLGDLLDHVLSADAVGVFKTDPRVYQLVEEHTGAAPERTLFVSSNRWDVAGAVAFGFRCVWVNRLGLPDEYKDLEPVARIADLSALA